MLKISQCAPITFTIRIYVCVKTRKMQENMNKGLWVIAFLTVFFIVIEMSLK